MTINSAPQLPTLVEGETNNFAVSFAAAVDDAELLSGLPSAIEQSTSDLTVGEVAVSATTLRINGRSVSPGKAVQFCVSGQLAAHSPYTLRITVATDAAPPQTKVRSIQFAVEQI